MPTADLRRRVKKMRALAAEAGRDAPDVGAIPFVVVAGTTGDALRQIPERLSPVPIYRGEPAVDAAGVRIFQHR